MGVWGVQGKLPLETSVCTAWVCVGCRWWRWREHRHSMGVCWVQVKLLLETSQCFKSI